MCSTFNVKCSWDGLHEGTNCSCVWLFWYKHLVAYKYHKLVSWRSLSDLKGEAVLKQTVLWTVLICYHLLVSDTDEASTTRFNPFKESRLCVKPSVLFSPLNCIRVWSKNFSTLWRLDCCLGQGREAVHRRWYTITVSVPLKLLLKVTGCRMRI